jgi:hypothetical protein
MAHLMQEGGSPRFGWGGRREGAGRLPSGRRVGVAHRPRPFHEGDHPVHVTWRVARDVPSLRMLRFARVVGRTIAAINRSHTARGTSFRVVHFSIQSNHLHLLVEGDSQRTLAAGLRGLGIWIARKVNEARGGRGRVIADRYHARPLTTPLQVRRAIVYVLQNHLHHQPSARLVDECSSARWFSGWAQPLPPPDTPSPVRPPATWLLQKAWKRYGLIHFHEGPAGHAPHRH